MSKNNKSESDLTCIMKEYEKPITMNVQNKNIILSKSVPSSPIPIPIPIPQNTDKKIYFDSENFIVGSFDKNKKIPIELKNKPTKHEVEEDSSDNSEDSIATQDSSEKDLSGIFLDD